jgi:hypothetical protein
VTIHPEIPEEAKKERGQNDFPLDVTNAPCYPSYTFDENPHEHISAELADDVGPECVRGTSWPVYRRLCVQPLFYPGPGT